VCGSRGGASPRSVGIKAGNVVHLSQTLARALNCSEEEIQNIRRGAIIHDIGKMGVPDATLLRPGALDTDEWNIMHQHTKFARDMLEGISFLRPAIDVIYSHHERWDGAGYPEGLKGSDILLAARIFTVVDNWDALSSGQPYRKACPPEKVVEYIRQNAGTMFDPKIVEVFLKMDKNLYPSLQFFVNPINS
jgi:putative nucleotidyltransferase with HDIG domain